MDNKELNNLNNELPEDVKALNEGLLNQAKALEEEKVNDVVNDAQNLETEVESVENKAYPANESLIEAAVAAEEVKSVETIEDVKLPETAPADDNLISSVVKEKGEKEDFLENPAHKFTGDEPKKKGSPILPILLLLIIIGGLGYFYLNYYEKSAMFKTAFNKEFNSMRTMAKENIKVAEKLDFKNVLYDASINGTLMDQKLDYKFKAGINAENKELYVEAPNGLILYAKDNDTYVKNKDLVVNMGADAKLNEVFESFNGFELGATNADKILGYMQEAFNNTFDKNKVTEKKVEVTLGKHCKGLKACKESKVNLRALTYNLEKAALDKLKKEFKKLVEADKELMKSLGDDFFNEEKLVDAPELDEKTTLELTFYIDKLDGKMFKIGDTEMSFFVEKTEDYISLYDSEDKFSLSYDNAEKGDFVIKAEEDTDITGTFEATKEKFVISTKVYEHNINLDALLKDDKQTVVLEVDGKMLTVKLNLEAKFNEKLPEADVKNAKKAEELTPEEAKQLEAAVNELTKLFAQFKVA